MITLTPEITAMLDHIITEYEDVTDNAPSYEDVISTLIKNAHFNLFGSDTV